MATYTSPSTPANTSRPTSSPTHTLTPTFTPRPSPTATRTPTPTATPTPQPKKEVFPEVWSLNDFDRTSYEFKANCFGEYSKLEECLLWEVTRVVVRSPEGREFELAKDFNVNSYSGEVTRRWVLYGPKDGGLPVAGKYTFAYYIGERVALRQEVQYEPKTVDFPKDVKWRREGKDLVVSWTAPAKVDDTMWYKVLVFPRDRPVISNIFKWDATEARLPSLPLEEGEEASLNVTLYFRGGAASSEHQRIVW